jgi:hypothetical protein
VKIYLVWNNWVPLGSPFELTEMLGVYGSLDGAHDRMEELAKANRAEYDREINDKFYVQGRMTEANYYYIESRSVE